MASKESISEEIANKSFMVFFKAADEGRKFSNTLPLDMWKVQSLSNKI